MSRKKYIRPKENEDNVKLLCAENTFLWDDSTTLLSVQNTRLEIVKTFNRVNRTIKKEYCQEKNKRKLILKMLQKRFEKLKWY